MRNRQASVFIAALLLLCLNNVALSLEHGIQQNIILDSDSAKLFEGFGRYFISPAKPETLTGTGQTKGEAVFKIVKVTNLQGNNPFNVYQPVYNFGGVLVTNVDDLINCVRGGVCASSAGSGFACSPSSATSLPAASAELCMKSSSSCGVYGSGCLSGIESFYAYYCDSGFCASYKLYVRGSNGYTLSDIQPSAASGPDGRFINLTSGQKYNVKMSKDGKRWQVSFTAKVNADKSVTLNVTNVTQL